MQTLLERQKVAHTITAQSHTFKQFETFVLLPLIPRESNLKSRSHFKTKT